MVAFSAIFVKRSPCIFPLFNCLKLIEPEVRLRLLTPTEYLSKKRKGKNFRSTVRGFKAGRASQ